MSTRFGGGPEARPATWEDGSNASDYDALADLFLSDESLTEERVDAASFGAAPPFEPSRTRTVDTEAPSRRAEVRPLAPGATHHTVEALIFGHMPPMSGAWAAQYAARIAKDSGEPVAFVRLHAGHTTVQVYGAPADGRFAATNDFGAAVRTAAGMASRVIVRVDETDEPSLVRWGALHEITLLAGADQAAIVAAYRSIKSIAAAMDEAQANVALRVSFTGVEEERGAAAFRKIERAAAAFLETPLLYVPGVARMTPTIGPTLHRAETNLDAPSALRIVAEAIESPHAPAVSVGAAATTPPRVRENVAAPGVAAEASAPAREAPPPRNEQHEAPPPKARPVKAAAPGASLASHLPATAVTTLRCPHAPDVEIAVSDDGTLRLLVDQRARGAIKSLLCARAWAMANAALLVAACRAEGAHDVRADHVPTMHVFVRDAKRARALLDTEVRTHLLMRVRIDDREAWACADLN